MIIDTNLTIFGGTGDLTFRKLLPALYTMDITGKLPGNSRIVIIGRRDFDNASYRQAAREWVEKNSRLPFEEKSYGHFSEKIYYYKMNFSELSKYEALDRYYRQNEIRSHLFYYAVAPRFFSVITKGLKMVGGSEEGKVILEKPFGENLASATVLNKELEAHFGAGQIYRIDHYLGKEMVRNIQAIRFANPIFTDVWNSRYIESVQISALEDMGVETRGGYYDASGALKDMVQNHLLQILSIMAMEEPKEMTPKGLHDAQLDVFDALRQADEESIKEPNVLIIKIQPTEGVYLQFNIKRPGDTDDIIPTKMDFCQNCNLVHQLNTPEAYERLITACMEGERSWFSQWDQIERCWNYISRLKELYSHTALPVYPYMPGTPGPDESGRLLEKHGHQWMRQEP